MILFSTQCFPPDIGGIETLIGSAADRLSKSGASVTVLADPIRSDKPELAFSFLVRRFGGFKPIRRWLKSRHVRQMANSSSASILIADSWKSLEYVGDLKIPIVTFAHGNELQEDPNSTKGQRIKAALARANHCIANSHFTADLLKKFGVADLKISIFHPPVEPQATATPDALANIDQRLHTQGPILTTVARLEPRKGIDDVIVALPELVKTYPDLIYAIGGGGDDRPRLEALSQQLGVGEHVVFLGRVNDAERAALLTRATIFVMPTREIGHSVEGFGISYIEAGWYGVQSIASVVGGGVDAVLNGKTGLCIDRKSEGDLARAIGLLLSDESMRREMGLAAAHRAQHELCWDFAITRLDTIIKDVLRKHAATSIQAA